MPSKAPKAAETTACPRCGKTIPVRGERGACPACGLGVRFVDAPERPCMECGTSIALPPGQDAVRCAVCGAWQSADSSRPLIARTRCPRCRRDVDVPLDKGQAACPRCGAQLFLGAPTHPGRDTL